MKLFSDYFNTYVASGHNPLTLQTDRRQSHRIPRYACIKCFAR